MTNMNEEFDRILEEIMNEKSSPAALLSIPGIYEIVSEYYNNEVLRRWEDEREGLDD